ncbi:MAG: NAD-dependent epimerase/dehydratase family protein [Acidobacteriota bacterium]
MNESHAITLCGARAIVTGASGFIGRWVASALAARGALVFGVVRDRSRRLGVLGDDWAEVIVRDLAVPDSAAATIRDVRPDIVFNLVGYGVAKHERDHEVRLRTNVGVVTEILEALQTVSSEFHGPRLVQAGSALEYGRTDGVLDEMAVARPFEEYGRTKLTATLAVDDARRSRGLPGVTARLFTVFGPGERPGRLFPTLVDSAQSRGRIPLSMGTQRRDWTYVEDAAEGLLRLASLPAERVLSCEWPFDAPSINLASGRLTSVADYARLVAMEFGVATDRLGFGDLEQAADEMQHEPVPVRRLLAATQWCPPDDLPQAIRRARLRIESLGRQDQL